MSKETVAFDYDNIRDIIGGKVVKIGGYEFVHDDHWDEVDGHPNILSDGTIDRLVNGELIQWDNVRGEYGGTKFIGCDFAPSPSNPDTCVCEDAGMGECTSINIDNLPDPEEWFSFDSVLGRNEHDDDSPQAVLSELQDTFEVKNSDYGNSWEKIGVIKRVIADDDGPNIVYLYPDGEYTTSPDESKDNKAVEAVVLADTPQNQSTFEENADGVITRLLDKIIRAYNLIILADEPQVENESSADAAEDASGYSAMLASLIRRQ